VTPEQAGRLWKPPAAQTHAARIGYACSTPASPGLQSQVDALRAAGCGQIFREDATARVRHRPERDRALRLAASIRTSTGGPVILAVQDLGRLARSSAELMFT